MTGILKSLDTPYLGKAEWTDMRVTLYIKDAITVVCQDIFSQVCNGIPLCKMVPFMRHDHALKDAILFGDQTESSSGHSWSWGMHALHTRIEHHYAISCFRVIDNSDG